MAYGSEVTVIGFIEACLFLGAIVLVLQLPDGPSVRSSSWCDGDEDEAKVLPIKQRRASKPARRVRSP